MVDRMRIGVRWVWIVLVAGVLSGVSGAVMTLVLQAVQHVMIGYSSGPFGTAFAAAARWRRIVAPMLGACLAGAAWWWLRRGRQVTPVAAMQEDDFDLRRGLKVVADALVQILIVGSGASIGREGAPRQVAAAASTLALRRHIADADGRARLVAAAAGAGLAAVYTTPLAGALYTVEVVQRRWSRSTLLLGLLVSSVATASAWPVTHDAVTYLWPSQEPPSWPVALAIPAAAPLWAAVGGGFSWLLDRARRGEQPTGGRLVAALSGAGLLLGMVSVALPQLPGNGKAVVQWALPHGGVVSIALLLVLTKPVLTALFVRAGATGGLLTPALATGAAAGGSLVGLLALLGVHTGAAPWVVTGAAGVLAVTQDAPWFAAAFVVELTHPPIMLMPSILATGILAHRIAARTRRPGRKDHTKA